MNPALSSTNGSTRPGVAPQTPGVARNPVRGDAADGSRTVTPLGVPRSSMGAGNPLTAPMDDGGQVKLALFGRPILELLSYAGLLYNSMENNEFFPDPQPPQDELAAVIAEAKASTLEAECLRGSYAAAVARRDEIIGKLTLKLDQRGNYVQMRSGGNSTRILSAGIDVRRDRRPVPPLEPPTGLTIELNSVKGLAIVTWNKVKNAKLYMMEYGPEDGPTVQRAVPGQRKLVFDDLVLGEIYQFRVRAMGGATGQSSWSPWVKRGIA